MRIYSEIKLTGDSYAGGYSCGLTMLGSGEQDFSAKAWLYEVG